MNEARRVPTPLTAAVVWVLSLVAIVSASGLVAGLAVAVRSASGQPVPELHTPAASPLVNDPVWFIGGAAVTQVSLGVVLAATLWLGRFNWRVTLPFARVRPEVFAGAVLVVFGSAPVGQMMSELMSRTFGFQLKSSELVSRMATSSTALEFSVLLLALTVLPALFEEGMFRGYITAAFARRSFATALIVPSLLFGIFHLEPTQAAGTAVLGMAFALPRLYTGSLAPSMVAHALYNGVVLGAARLFPGGDEHEIQPVPIAIGAVLFLAGLTILRRAGRATPALPPGSPQTPA